MGLGICSIALLPTLPVAASGDPVFDQEWALSTFQVQTIRNQYHAYGTGVLIAVIDGGIDPTQPDLQGQLVPGVNLSVPTAPNSDTNDTTSDYHGTHVAAIIAAHGHGDPSNLQGLVGLASRSKIMPIKDGADHFVPAAETASIRYAVDHGAKVINISSGTLGSCSALDAAAINYALSKNVVVVAAAGNDGNTTNTPSCPADQPGVISVTAIAQNGTMDPYSHYGSDVTVAAPGVGIEAAAPNGQYTQVKGTSDAAPWVASEAALILQLHPNWTVGQVIRVIIDNTVTGTGKRLDDHVGYGVIDPLKALGAATPVDTTNPLGGPAPAVANSTQATATSKKSSNIGLYIAGLALLIPIGAVAFFIVRGKKSSAPQPAAPLTTEGQFAAPQPPQQYTPTVQPTYPQPSSPTPIQQPPQLTQPPSSQDQTHQSQ